MYSKPVVMVPSENQPPERLKFFFDSPAQGIASINKGTLRLQGWAVCNRKLCAPDLVIIKTETEIHQLNFNVSRPDVIKHVSGGDPKTSNFVGFDYYISGCNEGFEVGFLFEGEVFWSYKFYFNPAMKVIEGRQGWLFLDNDTNQSKDQFMGKVEMGGVMDGWTNYFKCLVEFQAKFGKKVPFLVAPSKEFVMKEYYPYEAASNTIIDGIMGNFGGDVKVIYPIEALTNSKELSYWKGDTHWTDFGALLAGRIVLEEMGQREPGQHDGEYVYNIDMSTGDLGNKLFPHRNNFRIKLSYKFEDEEVTFKNNLISGGKMVIIDNPKSQNGKTCVVFGGSSSAEGFLRIISRHYERLVFVHTSGRVVKEILEHELPDDIILQINQRYLISPPKFYVSLSEVFNEKKRKEGAAIIKSVGKKNQFYNEMHIFRKKPV